MWSIHTHGSVRNEMNCFIRNIIDRFRVSYIYLRAPMQSLLKWFVPVSDQSLEIVSLSWILEAPIDSHLSVISLWNTRPQIQDQCCTLAYNGKDNDRLESLMPDILVYLTGSPVSVRWKGGVISQSDLQMVPLGAWTRHAYQQDSEAHSFPTDGCFRFWLDHWKELWKCL